MSQLAKILTSTPLSSWKVKQVLILDWYDGPREGFCEMASPPCCFHFKEFAENYVPEGLDERLFYLREIPIEGFRDVMLLLANELGEPKKPSWVPIWKFEHETTRVHIESVINTLIENSISSNIILQSSDLETISEVWRGRP
jgi:hypothetical protein